MNKHKNVLIKILILILMIIVTVLFYFIFPNDEIENKELEKDETKLINAYDFIIEILNKDQYWGHYNELYSSNGFKLIDEENAVFQRGKEGLLSIDFANNSAICHRLKEYSGHEYYDYIDFENNTIRHVLKGEYDYIENIDYNNNAIFNPSYIILETIKYYNDIFERIGCPLLNEPPGTLSSYKDKQIEIIDVEPFIKDAIWKRDDFKFDYLDDVVWLDDISEIFLKEVKESELIECYKQDGSSYYLNYYSPLFLVIIDKNDSKKYLDYDSHILNNDILIYDSALGAFMKYIAAFSLEMCYKKEAVFFIDRNNLKNGPFNIRNGMDKKSFIENSSINEESLNKVITVYLSGDKTIGNVYEFDINAKDINDLYKLLKRICEYYGETFPFDEDYLTNFYLFYSVPSMRILGLR